MTIPVQLEGPILARHGVLWRADHVWSLAAGASMYIGWTVGERDMAALGRDYFTLSTRIVVDLFEASYTGGTNMRTINRRLDMRDQMPPVQFKHSVTPGSLVTSVTGFVAEAAGPQRVGRQGDTEPFYHPAGTSWVLRITNGGNSTSEFSFALDYRTKIPGEY